MVPLPPIPPPHVIVRQAEVSVVEILQQQGRASASGLHQQYREQDERRQRDAHAQRRREFTAQLRCRTTTSQRI